MTKKDAGSNKQARCRKGLRYSLGLFEHRQRLFRMGPERELLQRAGTADVAADIDPWRAGTDLIPSRLVAHANSSRPSRNRIKEER